MRVCAGLLIFVAITLCAQAVFLVTLPDRVLDDAARATAKGERDLLARGRVPPRGTIRSDIEPLNVIGLSTDAQIDAAFADPAIAASARDSIRDQTRISAAFKGIFGVLLLTLGVLVLRRKVRAAGWIGVGLSLLCAIASVQMFLGLDLVRAVASYYTNTPLRIVEMLGIGSLPIATVASFAIGWTPKSWWDADISPRPRRKAHQDIDDYYDDPRG